MKKITLLCSFIAISLFACKKTGTEPPSNPEEDLYKNVPTSTIPSQLASGVWFYGTLSAISYFDRDGHKLHNDYEAGREYQFSNVNGKGRMKFWQYLGTKGFSSCTNEYYTYKEGSVVFQGDKFIFYPVKGRFRTVKQKCSSGNGTTEREAVGNDLKPDTYLWEIRQLNNKTYLYTFLETDVNHVEPLFVYSFTQ
jgi:hypothetical protein